MIAAAAAVMCAVLLPLIGGRVSRVARLRLRHEVVLLVLFVAQAVFRGRLPGLTEASGWAIPVWGVVCISLVVALYPSRGVVGVDIIITGLFANLLVTLVNQAMPYALPSGAAADANGFYRPVTDVTSLAWMGDVLPDPLGRSLLSIGDMLLLVGTIAVILAAATDAGSERDGA